VSHFAYEPLIRLQGVGILEKQSPCSRVHRVEGWAAHTFGQQRSVMIDPGQAPCLVHILPVLELNEQGPVGERAKGVCRNAE